MRYILISLSLLFAFSSPGQFNKGQKILKGNIAFSIGSTSSIGTTINYSSELKSSGFNLEDHVVFGSCIKKNAAVFGGIYLAVNSGKQIISQPVPTTIRHKEFQIGPYFSFQKYYPVKSFIIYSPELNMTLLFSKGKDMDSVVYNRISSKNYSIYLRPMTFIMPLSKRLNTEFSLGEIGLIYATNKQEYDRNTPTTGRVEGFGFALNTSRFGVGIFYLLK